MFVILLIQGFDISIFIIFSIISILLSSILLFLSKKVIVRNKLYIFICSLISLYLIIDKIINYININNIDFHKTKTTIESLIILILFFIILIINLFYKKPNEK
jgi:hypothetical protein